MPNIIVIGHITHDHIITPDINLHIPGGTAWYAAWCLHHLLRFTQGRQVGFHLITSVGPDDAEAIDALQRAGIQTYNLPSPATVYFENSYGHNMNNRRQRVLSRALPFTWHSLSPLIQDIMQAHPSAQRPIFLLGSLLADDFPLDVIRQLHSIGQVVVDVQGYLREVVDEQVHAIDWADKCEALRYVDVLKTNEHEMEVLTGHTDPLLAARQLAEWGVGEVLLTMGDKGSIIYHHGQAVSIPAYQPHPLVDATGCGDTYTTAYMLRRAQDAEVAEAGRYAAATATLKLQHSGPFAETEQDVLKVIQR